MAAKQKMPVAKKISIILASILAVIMLGICAWWIVIYFTAPQKVVSSTYNVGKITTADGSTTKNIIEVKYMSNKKKNGYEMLDIRYNYYHDEEKNEIYSQGLQYVGNNIYSKLAFEYMVDPNQDPPHNPAKVTRGWPFEDHYYDYWGTYTLSSDAGKIYNYASTDDYVTTFNSANPLSVNSRFKVEIGKDLYEIAFKGYNTPKGNDFTRVTTKPAGDFLNVITFNDDYYTYYSYDYFAMIIYNALQTGQYGMDRDYVMELPDLFDYYKCIDAEGAVYEEQPAGTDTAAKLVKEIRNYYDIKITISEDGAQSSQDSLFGAIHGNRNYNANPDRATDDYFSGRSIIDCTFNNFDYVLVSGDKVALKLKDSFIKTFLPYKSSIKLDVLIDKDEIAKMGYEYFGLASDNGLDNFTIYRARTVEKLNGHEEYKEIQL